MLRSFHLLHLNACKVKICARGFSTEILKSMSMAVTDAMSIATVQTLGLQQMRREAAIESAPKGSLTSELKRKFHLTPFTSKLLFEGQIGACFLLLLHPESLGLNLARIRLSLRRLLLISLSSLT